jgi:hypothetical protein
MEPYTVKDQYRINHLSKQPDGDKVTLLYKNGREYVYDKIKNVKKYLAKAFINSEVVGAYINDNREEFLENYLHRKG